ncbi:membrane hypothetical protein [groundwater metagenome]|uniref:Uncharacterized protein n=1 Tax=groundwater metagenome TaxID=717931 RepID=A0A098E6F3_9ZZZZ
MEFNLNKFKERILTIDSLGLLYILVVGGLCHILPILEIVKGFLALPGFLIVPYLVGNVFVPKKTRENEKGLYEKISGFVITWMLGLIVLTIGAMILEVLNLFNLFYYIVSIFIIIWIKILSQTCSGKRPVINGSIKILIISHYKEFIIIAIMLLLPIILLMGLSPFPTKNAGDSFRFCLGIYQIINQSLIPQLGVYFPFLEIIIASLTIIFNIHSFTIFWTGTFFSYFVYGFGIYLLGYRLSNNKALSLLMVLFAIFPFWSKTMNLYRFIPQTWIYFIFPYVLFVIHGILHQNLPKIKTKNLIKLGFVSLIISWLAYEFSTILLPTSNYSPNIRVLYFMLFWIFNIILLRLIFNTKDSIIIGTIFAFLVMIHHPMSFLAIAFLILYISLYFLSKYNVSYYYIVAYTLIFSVSIAIIFHVPAYFYPTGIFNVHYYNLGFSEKVDLLSYVFSYFTLFLFIIGTLYIVLIRFRDISSLSFLVMSLSAMFIYLLNVEILIRMLPFFLVFAVFIVSQGFLFVIHNFNNLSYKGKRFSIVPIILIITLICIFGPILNYLNDITTVGADSGISTISSFDKEEYDAALFIEKNLPNAIIISDPWTQNIISGLSGTQNLGEMNGGGNIKRCIQKIIISWDSVDAYNLSMTILSKNISTDYSIIKKEDIFQQQEIAVIRGNRFELNFTKKDPLIVITPRTIKYGKYSSAWFLAKTKSYIWEDMFPVKGTLDSRSPEIEKFFNSTYFELIYNDENKIYIFKVKNQIEQNESAKY